MKKSSFNGVQFYIDDENTKTLSASPITHEDIGIDLVEKCNIDTQKEGTSMAKTCTTCKHEPGWTENWTEYDGVKHGPSNWDGMCKLVPNFIKQGTMYKYEDGSCYWVPFSIGDSRVKIGGCNMWEEK